MNRVNQLFKIKYPIIQGEMIWCSCWRLASAVSNEGGLGLIVAKMDINNISFDDI